MIKRHFYVMCALPDLRGFRSAPPINKQELLAAVIESSGPADIVQALLLSEDLLQREAVLAGEREPDPVEMAVLSLPQVKGEAPLPDYLKSEPRDQSEFSGHAIAVDPIWQNYFLYIFEIGRLSQTQFLKAWGGFEVGMRNTLARARAEALDLDPAPYMVAQELADSELPFESIVADWRAASNPLEALETLDRARWNWVTEHERWYSFSNDEIAAYTVKTMILHRWQQITAGDKE